jgi:hypothetical protein
MVPAAARRDVRLHSPRNRRQAAKGVHRLLLARERGEGVGVHLVLYRVVVHPPIVPRQSPLDDLQAVTGQ